MKIILKYLKICNDWALLVPVYEEEWNECF